MAFVDEVTIRVQSGAGGDGCVSFRREKYVPYGGPNGGHGGRGGDVYLLASRNKQTLLDFKFRPLFRAERGEHGQGSECDGRGAEDLVIEVPVGTLVFDGNSLELLGDLVGDGTKLLVAKGGKGGRGNMGFKTSTNQAPRFATPGKPGETRELKLELRLIADIGLVGLPNAGKSSLLRVISRATPKVAAYPFTTLEPNLGVAHHKGVTFVVADLPGLIEGAADGAGLGHKFLRHVSRNRLLLHLVDASADNEAMAESIAVVRKELAAHDPALAARPELLVFTKADCLAPNERVDKVRALSDRGFEGILVSSQSGYGMSELLDLLSEEAARWEKSAPSLPESETVAIEEFSGESPT